MKHITRRVAVATLPLLGSSLPASAHCIIGNRFFPATVNVDDPCVADELSLPTIAGFKNGDDPSAQELDISGEYSKTITPNFGVSRSHVASSWRARCRALVAALHRLRFTPALA